MLHAPPVASADTAACNAHPVGAHRSTRQKLCCESTRSVLHQGVPSSPQVQGLAAPLQQCTVSQVPVVRQGDAGTQVNTLLFLRSLTTGSPDATSAPLLKYTAMFAVQGRHPMVFGASCLLTMQRPAKAANVMQDSLHPGDASNLPAAAPHPGSLQAVLW